MQIEKHLHALEVNYTEYGKQCIAKYYQLLMERKVDYKDDAIKEYIPEFHVQ